MIIVDDFGECQNVNDGTLELASKLKIDGVSIFFSKSKTVTNKQLVKDLEQLKELNPQIMLGLHFDIPLYKIPRIKKEFDRQLQDFIKVIGQSPDYIDGHKHIHGFSFVRNQFLKLIVSKKLKTRKLNLKSTKQKLTWASKIKRLLFSLTYKSPQYVHYMNESLMNVYSLSQHRDFEKLWKEYSRKDDGRTLFIIHPSQKGDSWKNRELEVILEN